MNTTADKIHAMCEEMALFLEEKNRSYGDSALRPDPVFARGEAVDLLRVRIDDKLNRIRHAPGAFGENDVKDLTGYLILLMIAEEEREEMGE